MKRRTRIVLRSALAVAFGIVTSVVVAWGIAFAFGERIMAKSRALCIIKPDALLTLNEASAVGRRQRMIWYIDSIDPKTSEEQRAAKEAEWEKSMAAAERHSWPDSWNRWGDLARESGALARLRQSAFGFPLPCVWYERSGGLSMFGSAMRVHGGYEIAKLLKRERTGFVAEAALGYRPIWFGLTVNSLAYGALWFVLFAAIARWRRRRASRRGKCPQCGYDLSGLAAGATCPECGDGAAA